MGTQSKRGNLLDERENASDQARLVFVFHLIGWDCGASFLDQSQSEVKQNQSNPESRSIPIENCSYLLFESTKARFSFKDETKRKQKQNFGLQQQNFTETSHEIFLFPFFSLDGSNKLMDASVESKKREERELHKLDIMAHRRLRDATAAAAVECQQHIEDCDKNIKFLKDTVG